MARQALKQASLCVAEEPVCDALRPGSTVAYCYRVLRELAPGGMSQLYLVEHLPSSSYAALKVATHPSCAVLAREYALLKRAAHANVVRAFEHGRLRDGRQYLVLELLPGADLAAWLATYRRLSQAHALTVLWQLSSALDHLHAQGVVHSDIKPSNIVLNVHDQRATLIDFGVAFDLASERVQRGSTGTRGYMAPEQLRGQGCSPASDRYALAAVAQELLGFDFPSRAARTTGASRRIARPLADAGARSARKALTAVFRRALHPTPRARYASARNFVNALARALSVEGAELRGPVAVRDAARADVGEPRSGVVAGAIARVARSS
jgi:serine/threonine protein kinase